MSKDITLSVLYVLGAALILSILGVIALTMFNQPIHDILPLVISNVIVGALGLLAPRPGTQDVNVINTAADPVPVEDKPQVPPLPEN